MIEEHVLKLFVLLNTHMHKLLSKYLFKTQKQIMLPLDLMKSTKVQSLGTPTHVCSLAQNKYLLLGMVTQHVESRSIREVQNDGLERESSLLPLMLTCVTPTCSRIEHHVSVFIIRRSDRQCKYAVGPLTLSQYVNDALNFEWHNFRENTFF